MKRRIYLIFGLIFLAQSGQVNAHDGRLDRIGCHYDPYWRVYHCHRGVLSGRFFNSRGEAESEYRKYRGKSGPAFGRRGNLLIGWAKVVDGDTIEIRDQRLDLYGIDALERWQRCRRKNGERYHCGRIAKYVLVDLLDDQRIACEKMKVANTSRNLAICWIGAKDVGASMVLSGWAMADRGISRRYVIHENRAKSQRSGVWRGDFLRPSEWRKRRKERRRPSVLDGVPWLR